jgi:hypothetical protein
MQACARSRNGAIYSEFNATAQCPEGAKGALGHCDSASWRSVTAASSQLRGRQIEVEVSFDLEAELLLLPRAARSWLPGDILRLP